MVNKVSGDGVSGIFKEFRKPLEELVNHPDVRAVNAGKSFNVGRSEGIKATIYDPQSHSLKLSCHGSKGGQEIHVVIPEEAVDRVRLYIEQLNKKYFH